MRVHHKIAFSLFAVATALYLLAWIPAAAALVVLGIIIELAGWAVLLADSGRNDTAIGGGD